MVHKEEGVNNITFYLYEEHRILDELMKEFKKLEENKIKFKIQEQHHIPLPEMCVNGNCVAGVNDIKLGVQTLLSP